MGKRIYGVQVGEEQWEGADLQRKGKCSALLYAILDTCKTCRNIKKVKYMTLKLRIRSGGSGIGD